MGVCWSFAVVKMLLLFAWFLGILQLGSTFATGIALNGSNIGSLCVQSATSCDLSNQGITSIAADTFMDHTELRELYLNNNQTDNNQ